MPNSPHNKPMKNFPEKFIERIKATLLENEVDDFLEQCTAPLPKTIRINSRSELDPANPPKNWHLKTSAIESLSFIERDDQKENPLGKTGGHCYE